MLVTSLTPEQRLSKAVVAIMGNPRYVALAGVLMIGDRSVDATKGDTACTNGRDEWYNPDFIDTLNDAELRFLVLHECYHKLYKHLTTWTHLYKENAQAANMACDYVINHKLVHDNTDGFATMPTCGLYDAKYAGWDSARVYADIMQNPPPESESGGSGMDSHDWEGAEELTAEEQRELARDLDEAIRQGALAAGKLGTGADRDLEQLLKPQVDWREVLREFITDTCSGNDYSTWARPNRRYRSLGVYLPTGITEQVGELVIAIDTSASIGQRELTTFLSEITGICESVTPSKIRLLYWDTSVAGDEEYEPADFATLAQSTKPRGGGGTDPCCVPAYMTQHGINPQAAIILTDGWVSSWGQWSCPTLWTILDNDNRTSDVGKTVHINSSNL